jgi:hypothetical protein
LDFCLLIQSYGTFLKLYITANKTKWSNKNAGNLNYVSLIFWLVVRHILYLYQHSSLLFGHLIGGLYPSGGGTKHSFLSKIGGQWRSNILRR